MIRRAMDFTLTEDQQAFRDTARQFATERMLPEAARWDAETAKWELTTSTGERCMST